MSRVSLKGALVLIASDKIKERSEGQDLLRQIFAVRENCEALSQQADSSGWLHVFQQCFGAVMLERGAAVRAGKGGAGSSAAASRLSKWAGLVRWLVKQAVRHITRKTVSAIFAHLMQAMVHRGDFLPALALDYIKALRVLLSRPEHLDNLDEHAWAECMARCWDAGLGRALDRQAEGWEWDEDDRNMKVDEPEGNAVSGRTTPRQVLTLEVVELLAIVPVLLSTQHAPLLPHPGARAKDADHKAPLRAGLPVLRDITLFLETHRTESSAHRSVLAALNLLLPELEFNYTAHMRSFGARLVPCLVNLFSGTRTQDMREDVLTALDTLLPFVYDNKATRSDDPSRGMIFASPEVGEAVRKFAEALGKELAGGAHGLAFGGLRFAFEVQRTSVKGKEKQKGADMVIPEDPYKTRLMMITSASTASDVYSWTALQMRAECVVKLHLAMEDSAITSTARSSSPTRSNKRRKLDDPLLSLVQECQHARAPAARIASLQTLLFILERHPKSLHQQLRFDVQDALRASMQDPDLGVQQWAMLCFATALAASPADTGVSPQDLLTIWQTALRRIAQETTCRAASLLAHSIVALDLLDHNDLLNGLHAWLRDLRLQPPPLICDSILRFLCDAIVIVQQDAQLYKLSLEDEIIAWFAQVWPSETSARPTNVFEAADVARLLQLTMGASAHHRPVAGGLNAANPGLKLVDYARSRMSSSAVRAFVLEARLTGEDIPDPSPDTPSGSANIDYARVKAITYALQQKGEVTLSLLDHASGSLTAATTRQAIDTCCASLLALQGLEQGAVPLLGDRQALLHSLLRRAVLEVCQPKWNLEERFYLLAGMSSMLKACGYKQSASSILLRPGPGARLSSQIEANEKATGTDPRQADPTLPCPWRDISADTIHSICSALKAQVQDILAHSREDKSDNDAGAQEEDDFAILADDQEQYVSAMTATRQRALIEGCLQQSTRLLTCCRTSHQRDRPAKPVKDRELLNILLSETDPCAFTLLGHPIFALVESSELEFNDQAAIAFLEVIRDYLRTYTLSKSPSLHNLALAFMRAILNREDAVVETRNEIVRLLGWYLSQIADSRQLAWQVRFTLGHVLRQLAAFPTMPEFAPAMTVLLDDPDTRVRLLADALVPASLSSMDAADGGQLYTQLSAGLNSATNIELAWTRAVYVANVVIVCPGVRRPAMFHIYQVASESKFMSAYLQGILDQIALRLGPCQLSDLYMAYAARILASQTSQGLDPLALPLELYGYRSRHTFASDLLRLHGPLLHSLDLDNGGQLFAKVCRAAATDQTETLKQMLPRVVALNLVDELNSREKDSSQLEASLEARLVSVLAEAGEGHDVERQESFQLGFVAALFLLIGDSQPDDPAPRASSNDDEPHDMDILLQSLVVVEDVHSPQGSWTAIRFVLSWAIARWGSEFDLRKLVMHATQEVCDRLATSIVASERMRLVRNLTLLMCKFAAEIAAAPALLAACNQSALAIFKTPDLSHAALPILRWTLRRLNQKALAGADLAFRYITSGQCAITNLANEVVGSALDSFEHDLLRLASSSAQQDQVAYDMAAAFWPREGALAARAGQSELTSLDVSNAMQSSYTDPANVVMLAAYCGRHPDIARGLSYQAQHGLRTCLSSSASSDHLPQALELISQLPSPVAPTSLEALYLSSPSTAHSTPLVQVLDTLVRAFSGGDLHARRASYRTLCSFVPPKGEAHTLSNLSTSVRKQLEIIPTLSTGPHCAASVKLNVLLDSETWAFLHRDDGPGWVCAFASLIAQVVGVCDADYTCLTTLLAQDATTSSELLPYLVHQLLLSCAAETEASTSIILAKYLELVLRSSESAATVLVTILAVLDYLRGAPPNQDRSALGGFRWLRIDPYVLCRAALRVQAYATALVYLELAGDSDFSEWHKTDSVDERRELLLAIYNHVGDPDGFYGIPASLDFAETLIQRLHHEQEWSGAFSFHSARYEANPSSSRLHAVGDTLYKKGYNHLARQLAGPTAASLESAWRTNTWDLPLAVVDGRDQSGLYTALRAVHREREHSAATTKIQLAAASTAQRFGQVSREDLTSVRALWREVLCLREVERWSEHAASGKSPVEWSARGPVLPSHLELDDALLVLSVRKSLLSALDRPADSAPALGDLDNRSASSQKAQDLTLDCDLQATRLALAAHRPQEALAGIVSALDRQARGQAPPSAIAILFAQVLWQQEQHSLAIDQLVNVADKQAAVNRTSNASISDLAAATSLLGEWTWIAKRAKATVIEQKYFRRSVDWLSGRPAEERSDVFARYARFADQQQQVLARSTDKVDEIKAQANVKKQQMKDLRHRASLASNQNDYALAGSLTKHTKRLEIELQDDEALLKAATTTRMGYLVTACNMYARALTASDCQDDAALRLCSLWLEQANVDEFNQEIKDELLRVPTHKFVTLVRQLTARMLQEREPYSFQANLTAVLHRMCDEHPFHILYNIITQAHSVRKSTRRQSSQGSSRELAALDMLGRVKAGARQKVLGQMDAFASAAMSWASEATDPATRSGQMPSHAPVAQLKNLSIPVPTLDLPVDPTCKYAEIVSIQAYESRYTIAGGLSRPKIMRCVGSDGQTYSQLFKGRDDMRQDAVMEQVFGIINRQLQKDPITSRRRLRFRTYNVLPLANLTGVIEFVPNTMAIGDWLVPAHTRYHPTEIDPKTCKDLMKALQPQHIDPFSKRSIQKELEAKYTEIKQNFRPVFRHFFRERQSQPMAWFLMRLNFARSLSVTSIAGHVLGLGDRHLSNIMVDRKNGELVHIDLGIAFDQGRLLSVPERVPFRMTADMIDGLGMLGIEGTFKRCAQHTLTVLRSGSEILMTVLECLKYDPLQDWVANAARKRKAQGGAANDLTTGTSTPGSDVADKALQGVARKLSPDLSVEYTVNSLLQEAMDPAHLATIFIGWQSWI